MYQHPVSLGEDWLRTHYENPQLDFVIDVGCARGTWCLKTAASDGANKNFLGLDVRRPVVEDALARKERAALGNVHFLASNANVDLPRLLRDIAQLSRVSMICIHHPDPLFKLRHKKRSVVTQQLVQDIASRTDSRCAVYLQSDVPPAIQDMADEFERSAAFEAAEGYSSETLADNPSPHAERTEREASVLAQGLPIYRMLLVKKR